MNEIIAICKECGVEDTLDPGMRICFECWCLLDLKEHEQQKLEEE
jgi:hypothetical protein